MKSTLISGPPRFRFQPRSSPPQMPASMMRFRRSSMLDLRFDELTPALRYDGYVLEIQATMKSPSREAQLPPLPPGGGDDGGCGAGAAAAVTKVAVDDHGPWFSGSDARTRQKRVAA